MTKMKVWFQVSMIFLHLTDRSTNPSKVQRTKPVMVKVAQKIENIKRVESEKHLSHSGLNEYEDIYNESLNEFEGPFEIKNSSDNDNPFLKIAAVSEPSRVFEDNERISLSHSEKDDKNRSSGGKQDDDTNITGAKNSLSSFQNKSGNQSPTFETPDRNRSPDLSVCEEMLADEQINIRTNFIASKDVGMTPSLGCLTIKKALKPKLLSIKTDPKSSKRLKKIIQDNRQSINMKALAYYNSYSATRRHKRLDLDSEDASSNGEANNQSNISLCINF